MGVDIMKDRALRVCSFSVTALIMIACLYALLTDWNIVSTRNVYTFIPFILYYMSNILYALTLRYYFLYISHSSISGSRFRIPIDRFAYMAVPIYKTYL